MKTCKSLSGKSTLKYELSKTAIRITANSGSGFFNPEWVPLEKIRAVLAKATPPITSAILSPLIKGKSANTPAFLLAALKHEGWVQGKARNLEAAKPKTRRR